MNLGEILDRFHHIFVQERMLLFFIQDIFLFIRAVNALICLQIQIRIEKIWAKQTLALQFSLNFKLSGKVPSTNFTWTSRSEQAKILIFDKHFGQNLPDLGMTI